MKISTSKSKATVPSQKRARYSLQVSEETFALVEEFKNLGILFMRDSLAKTNDFLNIYFFTLPDMSWSITIFFLSLVFPNVMGNKSFFIMGLQFTGQLNRNWSKTKYVFLEPESIQRNMHTVYVFVVAWENLVRFYMFYYKF